MNLQINQRGQAIEYSGRQLRQIVVAQVPSCVVVGGTKRYLFSKCYLTSLGRNPLLPAISIAERPQNHVYLVLHSEGDLRAFLGAWQAWASR